MLEVKIFKVGSIPTNCYIIKDVDKNIGVIVDPGGESNELEQEIFSLKEVKYILLTHGHFDHILKAKKYREMTGSKIVISELDKAFTQDNFLNLSNKFLRRSKGKLDNFDADVFVKEGDELSFAGTSFKVMSTPGHTQGSVCYILGDKIFSGDTLFSGDCGYARFPTGNKEELKNSIHKLYDLNTESSDYIVYPGHAEITLLSQEKLNKTGI